MITSCDVHSIIQQLNTKLAGHDNVIAINTIAQNLHVGIDELRPHLDTLLNMYYISFTDRKNEKIKLTFSGMYAPIPGFPVLIEQELTQAIAGASLQ